MRVAADAYLAELRAERARLDADRAHVDQLIVMIEQQQGMGTASRDTSKKRKGGGRDA